jgi:hypothetical protein
LNQAEAEKLAEEIVNLDEGIFGVGILSNTGEAVGGYVRSRYRKRYSPDRLVWSEVAFKEALICGSAKETSKMLSGIESIVFIRRESKGMLILVQDRAIIVGIVFDKSMNGTDLSNKIRTFLGL